MVQPGINTVAFAEFCKTLVEKELTKEELAKQVGICAGTCTTWIRLLEKRKLVYVSGWKRHSNGWVAMWTWGYKMESLPRPKAMSDSETSRRWRLKQSLQKEQQDLQNQEAKRMKNGNKRSSGIVQSDSVGRSSSSGASLEETLRIFAGLSAQEVSESYQDTQGS